jgi:hypothetical protein
MTEWIYLRCLAETLCTLLLERLGEDERGEITEKVIVTAIFAALALAAGAIIVGKVTERANAIPTQ